MVLEKAWRAVWQIKEAVRQTKVWKGYNYAKADA
jgi:hypothetical protein